MEDNCPARAARSEDARIQAKPLLFSPGVRAIFEVEGLGLSGEHASDSGTRGCRRLPAGARRPVADSEVVRARAPGRIQHAVLPALLLPRLVDRNDDPRGIENGNGARKGVEGHALDFGDASLFRFRFLGSLALPLLGLVEAREPAAHRNGEREKDEKRADSASQNEAG